MLLVALELLLSVSSLPALLSPLRSERVVTVTMVHHTSILLVQRCALSKF